MSPSSRGSRGHSVHALSAAKNRVACGSSSLPELLGKLGGASSVLNPTSAYDEPTISSMAKKILGGNTLGQTKKKKFSRVNSIEARYSNASGRHSIEMQGGLLSKATPTKGKSSNVKAKRAAAAKAGQFIINSGSNSKKVVTGNKPSTKYKF